MTPQQIKEMNDAFDAFKKANDAALAEVKKYGEKSGVLEQKVADLNDAIEHLEAKFSRKGGFAGDHTPKTEAKKLFFDALRGKNIAHEELQRKALITGNDVSGGYLAPLEYSNELVADIVEYSPIRSIARVRQTSRMGIQVPKKTGNASASWVSETGNRNETTNPAFGTAEIRPHEMYALTKVSKAELEDSAFDLEIFLRQEFAEQFGVLEGVAFVSGNGNGQPEGILTNMHVGEVVSGHASQITADGLIDLVYEVKEAYLNNASFVLSRSTLKAIRKLKDGQGQYLWSPGIKEGLRPATILDFPYVTAVDMPSIGAGAYPVLFGDFRRGYMILDRVAMEVMVDPISSKATGFVEFSGRRRVGGQVTLAEALKKLKVAAS